jgi:hypothetical protein
MMMPTLLLVLFGLLFFTVIALVVFYLFAILLPTLGQTFPVVENPLMALTPETVPAFDDLSFRESPDDFLPLTHNSPNDCKVLEALHNSPQSRKCLCGAFASCIYTCPRVQINFSALLQSNAPETPAEEIALTTVPDCSYFSKSVKKTNKLTPLVNATKQKASALYAKILKGKEK